MKTVMLFPGETEEPPSLITGNFVRLHHLEGMHLPLPSLFRRTPVRGAWVAQLIGQPTLGFSSRHGLGGPGMEPRVFVFGLFAPQGVGLRILSAPFPARTCTLSLSNK